jgi:hypothetical protein
MNIEEKIKVMNSGPLGDFVLYDKEALEVKKELKTLINDYEGEDGDEVKLIVAMFICSDVPMEKLMKGLKKEKVVEILKGEYIREVDYWADPEGFNFENCNEYTLNPISNMYLTIKEIVEGKRNRVFDENKFFEIVTYYMDDDKKERMNKEDEKLLIKDGSFLYPYLKYLKRIEKLEEFVKEFGTDILNKKLELIEKKVEEI